MNEAQTEETLSIPSDAQLEEAAGGLFDEITFICEVLIAVDEAGGNQAFSQNESYQKAISLAEKWSGRISNALSGAVSTH
jgi:hypothetical protein